MGLFDKFKKKAAAPEQHEIPKETQPDIIEKKPKRVPEPEEIIEAGDAQVYFPKDGDEPDWYITTTVNLTEKSVKVEVPYRERQEDSALEKGLDYYSEDNVYLWEDEGLIRCVKGDDIIFEVTKRSKAYNELMQFARRKASRVSIWQETSDYGKYYRARLRFHIVIYKWKD